VLFLSLSHRTMISKSKSRVYLTAPTTVYHTTRQLNRPTGEFKATRLGGESPQRPRESQQEQSVFWVTTTGAPIRSR
jgi:hypothetical protein